MCLTGSTVFSQLDKIETHGDDEIRTNRKAAIKAIQVTLDQLELKGVAAESNQ